MKNEVLNITVSDEVYEAIQEDGLRMALVSPEGEQAAKIHSAETGFKHFSRVEIAAEDGRKRKLSFEHVGSDRVKYPYIVKAGKFSHQVQSMQLRVVLGEAIEKKEDAIKEIA